MVDDAFLKVRGKNRGGASENIVAVKDTLAALGDAAKFLRGRFKKPLIALSGSCGKTTTKEMIYEILSISLDVHKNEGNYNNLVGVPLTLFKLKNTHDCCVLELGINSGRAEMRRLCEIASPDIALLTNIGDVHLEGLGDIKGVAEAKTELLKSVKADGCLIVNLDDPEIFGASRRLKAKKITYGIENKGDIHLKQYKDGWEGTEYIVEAFGRDIHGHIRTVGLHNIYNLLASVAVAKALEVGDRDIAEGLNNFKPVPGRMELVDLGEIRLLNDTYNANPLSMESSLRAFDGIAKGCRRMAVLGDMMELGGGSERFHRYLGRFAANLGIDLIYCIGEYGETVKNGAIEMGMADESVKVFNTKRELLNGLKMDISKGDFLFIKGSRGVALEEIIDPLKKIILNKRESSGKRLLLN